MLRLLLLSGIVILFPRVSPGQIAVSPYTAEEAAVMLGKHSKFQPDTSNVTILLKLSQYYATSKKQTKTVTDSALLFAEEARVMSEKINFSAGQGKSLLASSMAFRRLKKKESGEEVVKKAINIFSTINSQQFLAESYLEWSLYYEATPKELPDKIRLMQSAAAAFEKAGNTTKVADCFKEIADYRQVQGNFSQSLADLKQALKLCPPTDLARLAGIYDLLGFVSTSLGDQKEGVRYGLLAVETAEKLNDSSMQICTFYNRLGITYLNINETAKASLYFTKAIKVAEQFRDVNAIHELALNNTNLLLKQNKARQALALVQEVVKKYPAESVGGQLRMAAGFVTIYETLGRQQEAGEFCQQLLRIAGESELNDEEQGLVYSAIIPFYLSSHQYKDAKKYLLPDKLLAQKTGSLMNLSLNHLWWFQSDSAQGNYISAIGHYQQYKQLNDSLFNEAKSRQINQLEILYNIEKKDQDIQLKEQNIQLLTKQGQLQETKLQQATILRNLTFIGIALLLVIVGLLFNRYRLKQRTNKKLEAQQKEINRKNESLQQLVEEKEWLVKEIHHRIKNNLHMVVGLLDTQSGFLKSDEAKEAIADSQHRVNAMSMIHQKLYQSENLSVTDMAAYINELVEYLRDAFNTGQRIHFNMDIDRVQMDLSRFHTDWINPQRSNHQFNQVWVSSRSPRHYYNFIKACDRRQLPVVDCR
ncbi:MAG: histidine kinase dimerization/phosphoacceptor domain -containing protein [Chitinophagaceae bacterium]